jgi:hypothetical protein
MSEGRPLSKNDLFGDFLDTGGDTLAQQEGTSYTVGGKSYVTKQDIKGNQVKTQLGWGGVKRVKP